MRSEHTRAQNAITDSYVHACMCACVHACIILSHLILSCRYILAADTEEEMASWMKAIMAESVPTAVKYFQTMERQQLASTVVPAFFEVLLSCLILSYLILSYLILSYLILSYLILSYLITSYLILSYLV